MGRSLPTPGRELFSKQKKAGRIFLFVWKHTKGPMAAVRSAHPSLFDLPLFDICLDHTVFGIQCHVFSPIHLVFIHRNAKKLQLETNAQKTWQKTL